MFRQCPSPRKCKRDDCNSSHSTLLHGADKVFPAKPAPNNNINNSNSNAGTSRSTTGQQKSGKTTFLVSVFDVKPSLQVTELKLTNFLVLVLRRWFYEIQLAVTLRCPIVSQLDSVCKVPH